MPVKESKKLVNRTCHVLEELGMSAFQDALKNCIRPQLEAHADQLASLKDTQSLSAAQRLRHQIPSLSRSLQEIADALGAGGAPSALQQAPPVSAKAEELLRLVMRLFAAHAQDSGYRGIIFVEQVTLTLPLAHLITSRLGGNGGPSAAAISGGGSMTESVRSKQMEEFRRGQVQVLVCTNALEEGVDVSDPWAFLFFGVEAPEDCAFVIRFNKFHTTKSHIQGSGRARKENAEIYYFDNCPENEEEKARRLNQVAKDEQLQLSAHELQQRRKEHGGEHGAEHAKAERTDPCRGNEQKEGVYPFYPPGGSEVNFFNAPRIVYEYCAKTMGQSINPEDLFTYTEEVVCVYPMQTRRMVSEVKDKRRALFVVAIHMHRNRLLDAKNQPSAEALAGTKLACEAMPLTLGKGLRSFWIVLFFRRKRKWSDQALGIKMKTTNYTAPAAAPAPTAPTAAPEENCKGRLNDWALKKWRKPADELVTYATGPTPQGFVSTVKVMPLEQSFSGAAAAKKKDPVRSGPIAPPRNSQDPLVRKSAVQAIPRVAGKGCGTAIHALLPMMQDESVDVRLAAVRSLWQVAPAGHGEAIEALRVRLEDQEISKDGVDARALKKMVTCREELQKIAEHLNFQGPTLRGF
eukprot:g19680.t1